MKHFLVFFLMVLVACHSELRGQNDLPELSSDTLQTDTSVILAPATKRNTFKTIFRGEPGKAALYSLLIPGGGQVYNKKWWKVPIAIGIDAFFIYQVKTNTASFNKFDKIVTNYNNGIRDAVYSEDVARNNRSIARQNKEYSWFYLIIGHLVTVFDAYVDRHMRDFDINPDLSLSPQGPSNTLSSEINLITFSYHFSR